MFGVENSQVGKKRIKLTLLSNSPLLCYYTMLLVNFVNKSVKAKIRSKN